VIVARHDAHLDQSAAGVLVANTITLTDSTIALAVAETVNGNVSVQAKPAVAAAFGAAFGAALGVALLIGRRGKR
jgi:hypothetical protein